MAKGPRILLALLGCALLLGGLVVFSTDRPPQGPGSIGVAIDRRGPVGLGHESPLTDAPDRPEEPRVASDERTVATVGAEDPAASRAAPESSAIDPLRLHGRVVTEMGEPVTEFSLLVRRPGSSSMIAKHSRSADGTFAMTFEAGGTWELSVTATGFLQRDVLVELPRTEVLEIVLERGTTLTVRVLDGTGSPVFGAEVLLRYHDHLLGSGSQWNTKESGHATFHGLQAGRVTLVARRDKVGCAVSPPIDLVHGEERVAPDLVLTPGGRIEGVAFLRKGTPEPRLMLSLRSHSTSSDLPEGLIHRRRSSWSDGRFFFSEVPPGKYTLRVEGATSPRRAVPRRQWEVSVQEGGATLLDLFLHEGVEIAVRGVVTANGEPLQGVEVTPRLASTHRSRVTGGTFTDEDGLFEVVLDRPGRYDFELEGPSTEGNWCVVASRVVSDTRLLPLSFELRTGYVQGRVVDSEGNGVYGAVVFAQTLFDDRAISWGLPKGSKQTNVKGYFWFNHLPEGRYRLSCANADAVDVEVAAGGETEDVMLLQGPSYSATIAGVVSDPDGRPVSNARIELGGSVEGSAPAAMTSTRSEPDGSFAMEARRPTWTWVRARRGDCVSPWTPIDLRAGRTTRCDLRLTSGGFVRARVVGELVEGQKVWIRGRDSRGLGGFVDWTTEGSVRVGPLLPGAYSARAYLLEAETAAGQAFSSEPVKFEVSGAGEVEVLFEFE